MSEVAEDVFKEREILRDLDQDIVIGPLPLAKMSQWSDPSFRITFDCLGAHERVSVGRKPRPGKSGAQGAEVIIDE